MLGPDAPRVLPRGAGRAGGARLRGAPDDVAVLAGAVGRGLLRRGEERMRERGGLAFVLPPWRPDLRRHRTLLCELDARTRRAEPEPTCARELGPAVLQLPPRAPSQLAFAW